MNELNMNEPKAEALASPREYLDLLDTMAWKTIEATIEAWIEGLRDDLESGEHDDAQVRGILKALRMLKGLPQTLYTIAVELKENEDDGRRE